MNVTRCSHSCLFSCFSNLVFFFCQTCLIFFTCELFKLHTSQTMPERSVVFFFFTVKSLPQLFPLHKGPADHPGDQDKGHASEDEEEEWCDKEREMDPDNRDWWRTVYLPSLIMGNAKITGQQDGRADGPCSESDCSVHRNMVTRRCYRSHYCHRPFSDGSGGQDGTALQPRQWTVAVGLHAHYIAHINTSVNLATVCGVICSVTTSWSLGT